MVGSGRWWAKAIMGGRNWRGALPQACGDDNVHSALAHQNAPSTNSSEDDRRRCCCCVVSLLQHMLCITARLKCKRSQGFLKVLPGPQSLSRPTKV